MTNITRQDLLLANIQVGHSVGKPAELIKPTVLKEIETQLNNNLDWFTPSQVAAYVGLQIFKNRPFLYANNATATALALSIMNLSGKKIIDTLAIPKINNALMNTSVVDDVSEALLLVCE